MRTQGFTTASHKSLLPSYELICINQIFVFNSAGTGFTSRLKPLRISFFVCFSVNKVGELIEKMVGYNLTTPQTLPDGVLVKKVTTRRDILGKC